MDAAPTLNKPLATLNADDLQRYQTTVSLLGRQTEWIRQTQTALDEGRIIVQALENERIRLWRSLCEVYGLDAEITYAIDNAGRVFESIP